MANSVDPDHTPHFAACDLGLHCLLKVILPISLGKYGSKLKLNIVNIARAMWKRPQSQEEEMKNKQE